MKSEQLTRLEDCLASARSLMHMIKLASETIEVDEDKCAFQDVAFAASGEIRKAFAIVDELREELPC